MREGPYEAADQGSRPRFCEECRPLRGRFSPYQIALKEQRRAEAASKRAQLQRCERCSGSFTGRQRRFCSKECRAKYQVEKRNPSRYQPRSCPGCGAVFTPGHRDQRQTYCSEVCRARFPNNRDKGKRRALMRCTAVEPIDPIVVFERDSWVCIICGVSTPPELRGTTDPRAPEPDHDVPLGRGGTHTYDNINCTCRACNQAKGLMTLEEYRRTRGGVES